MKQQSYTSNNSKYASVLLLLTAHINVGYSPSVSKFPYTPTPTIRRITDLNYVLMMQGHRDCATHRVAEKTTM